MPVGLMIGGAVLSGAIGAYGATQAANTQASAQEQAAATQRQMFEQIRKQEQPFLQGGVGAEQRLNKLMGYFDRPFKMTDKQLENSPGYQFQLQQGDQAIQNADSATQGALSGATLKDMSKFNEGLAQSTYQNYFNMYQTQQNNIFNRLNQLAGLGQNAAGNLGNNSAQLGTGIAQAQAGIGASLAGGQVGAANALGGAASSIPLYALLAGNRGPAAATTDPGNDVGLFGG